MAKISVRFWLLVPILLLILCLPACKDDDSNKEKEKKTSTVNVPATTLPGKEIAAIGDAAVARGLTTLSTATRSSAKIPTAEAIAPLSPAKVPASGLIAALSAFFFNPNFSRTAPLVVGPDKNIVSVPFKFIRAGNVSGRLLLNPKQPDQVVYYADYTAVVDGDVSRQTGFVPGQKLSWSDLVNEDHRPAKIEYVAEGIPAKTVALFLQPQPETGATLRVFAGNEKELEKIAYLKLADQSVYPIDPKEIEQK